jgi:NitT/TauT family transport system substrate-binding protein
MLAGAAAVPVGMGLAACSKKSTTSTKSTATQKVSYVTAFGAYGREGYAWEADGQGYFKDANADVTIIQGQAGEYNLNLLRTNKAQFAVIDYSGGVVRAGTGKFDGLVIIGAITQQTIIALMALAGKGISRPSDLVGKTVAQATGAVPKTLFPGYAKLAGFDPTMVHWQETDSSALIKLLGAGQVDAIGQFVPAKGTVKAGTGGKEIVVLPYSEELGDLYGNVLVTTTKMLNDNRDFVTGFAKAVFKGLTYSAANPDKMAATLHQKVPTTAEATAKGEMVELAKYIGKPVGAMDPTRVARGVALIEGLGLIPKTAAPESFVDFKICDAVAASTSS